MIKKHLVQLSKWQKRSIAFLSDCLCIVLAGVMAGWLSSSNNILTEKMTLAFSLFFIIQAATAIYCGLYRGVWRFASLPDLIRIVRAAFFGTVIGAAALHWLHIDITLKTYVCDVILLVTCLTGSRLLLRLLRDYPKFFSKGKRILVVGAGSAGEGLIRDLYRSSDWQLYFPVGFVDDAPSRQGCEVQGIRVLGTCAEIPALVESHDIELILIAIPSANSKRMRQIVDYCEAARVPFRTLPSLKNITDGVVKISSLREIELDDLLGREPVNHDHHLMKRVTKSKTILVTGGGGSIGSELCRQLCQFDPEKLIIVDNSEYHLYTIDLELRKRFPDLLIHSHLCNITDKIEIEKIFATYQPELIFHVAAYKHVPLLESHLRVAVQNNILGTKIVAELATQYSAGTFVLISTDKAVNPTNIMGATKRAGEVYCQTLNAHAHTRFITVRFGNVLDSAGSVIPLFREQIRQGGPVTVTHPDITRYFMTIPEAAQLILQATGMDCPSGIFVLDMGEPINISYLAEQMIKLSGKIVGQDIKIIYTGLREGEKLHEELFHENEFIKATAHPKIHQAEVRQHNWQETCAILTAMQQACDVGDNEALLALLMQLVPEYQSENSTLKGAIFKLCD